MSSLNYCNQTKYENKQSLLWNLCVLLTYIFCYCESLSFYVNNYSWKITKLTMKIMKINDGDEGANMI
jgi:hypothetical protein